MTLGDNVQGDELSMKSNWLYLDDLNQCDQPGLGWGLMSGLRRGLMSGLGLGLMSGLGLGLMSGVV